MKSLFTLTTFFLISLFANAQIFGHLEDRGVYNSYSDVINVGDSMWVAIGSHNGITSLSTVYIQAFGTSGEELWETELSEEGIEDQEFESLQILPNGNFLISSTATSCCDCLPYYPQTYVFAPDGELLYEQSYENSFTAQGNGIAFTESLVARVIHQNGDPDTHQLKATSHELTPEWTFDSGSNQIPFVISVDDQFAIFRSGEIILLNENGEETNSAIIEEVPQEVYSSPNGRNFLLMTDGLYKLNSDLTTSLALSAIDVDPDRVFIDNEFVYVLNNETSAVDQYDTVSFSLISTTEFENLPYFNFNAFAVNSSNIGFAGEKRFVDVSAPPYTSSYGGAALFTTDFSGDALDHNPDLGLNITDMQIDSHYLFAEESSIYNVYATLSGYAKNEGDVVIDSFHLNFYHMGGCFSAGGDRVIYEDVNLQPGDSIEVSISGVSDFSASNELFELCAFVSDPSHLYDRNELNDISCGSAFFTSVSEFEASRFTIYPNPTKDWLNLEFENGNAPAKIKILDLSGRMVSEITPDIENGKLRIDVSTLTAGVYLMQVAFSGKSVSIEKIVVE